MPMDHVKYHLPDYVNKRLDDDLRKGVEAHLQECSACRFEYEQLQKTFALIRGTNPIHPAPTYFQSLLPKIRQRMEQRSLPLFMAHPLVVRVAAPLAVAVVAIALLLHTPFVYRDTTMEENPLKSVLSDMSADELVQVIAEQTSHQPFNGYFAEAEADQTPRMQPLENESLGREVELLHTTVSEFVFGGTSAQQGLAELSEAEVEALLQQLVERTTL